MHGELMELPKLSPGCCLMLSWGEPLGFVLVAVDLERGAPIIRQMTDTTTEGAPAQWAAVMGWCRRYVAGAVPALPEGWRVGYPWSHDEHDEWIEQVERFESGHA